MKTERHERQTEWLEKKKKAAQALLLSECPTVKKAALKWAEEYLGIPQKDIEQAWQEKMDKAGGKGKEKISFQMSMKLLVETTAELAKEKKVSEKWLEYFDDTCKRALHQDKPALMEKLLVLFADTNYAEEVDGNRLPVYDCFYMNPRTLKWETRETTEDGSTSRKTTFSSLEVFPNVSQLAEPIRKKQLLCAGLEMRKELNTLRQDFYRSWKKLHELKPSLLSASEKKMISKLLAPSDLSQIPEELLALPLMSVMTHECQEVLDCLRVLILNKLAYSAALNTLCSQQNPTVDLLQQPLFVTHMEASSESTEALDAAQDHFREKLRAILT